MESNVTRFKSEMRFYTTRIKMSNTLDSSLSVRGQKTEDEFFTSVLEKRFSKLVLVWIVIRFTSMRFQVLTASSMKMAVFWDVPPFSL
jgi:hypothetical protein